MSYPNTKEMNESMYSKGTFAVGVHKRNVAPQNHFSKNILNDHYIYKK
jgi:hypothetical protein